jgi:two-component system chemotaxis response regulator CheY
MSSKNELKFLIVDDFSMMRRITRSMLKECGFVNVEEAEDGNTALEKLGADQFAVVVTNINLPLINGLELLSKIRADDALKHLRVLMVVAEPSKQEIAMTAGASGCILKPFNREMLEEKLTAILHTA